MYRKPARGVRTRVRLGKPNRHALDRHRPFIGWQAPSKFGFGIVRDSFSSVFFFTAPTAEARFEDACVPPNRLCLFWPLALLLPSCFATEA